MDGTGGESETTFYKSDQKSCTEFLPISQQTRLNESLITTIISPIRFVQLVRFAVESAIKQIGRRSKISLCTSGMSEMSRKSWSSSSLLKWNDWRQSQSSSLNYRQYKD